MSFVEAPAKILVTGASGFLGSHCAAQLIADGYQVVGTVRSQAKGKYLENIFQRYGGKFSFSIVPDIEKEGAFDEAVVGVAGVLHTASPFHYQADDPNDLIGPAVSGTTGVLKSIQKHAPTVKRVVITSSGAAIMTPKQAPYTWSEADWNTSSPGLVEKLGKKASAGDKYRASKTLAEKAAWEFVEANRDQISFDLVTINPTLILGPIIHDVSSTKDLNESNARLYSTIKDVPSKDVLIPYSGGWVDVRDVALAHSRALSTRNAGGLRIIASGGTFAWQDVLDTLRAAGVPDIPEGYPSDVDHSKYHHYNAARSKEVLGLVYHEFSQTLVDTVNSIHARTSRTM
ncbi:D-lactaldehyde dehydrogenase [Clavulina sp. PMI_390]|nr:D-lactaldehyde dehydrogenase [Clavulina sp. PMI_390]